MKRQKASSIYFVVTCFTLQSTCHEKIYIFTFKIKIDHQFTISPGPLLQKLKWLSHLHIWTYLCWRNKRRAVLKEKGCPVPNMCAAKALTQVALKQKQHNSVDPITIQCVLHQLFHYQGRAPWRSFRMELLPEGFLIVVAKFQFKSVSSGLQCYTPTFFNLTPSWN